MKKLLSLILAAVCLLSAAALAETSDLETMDFESLAALKTAVDAELNARPEAEKFELVLGEYTAGVDIKPGRYYAVMSRPKSSVNTTSISVYRSKEAYEKDEHSINYYSMDFTDIPVSVVFEEGNYIRVLYESATLKVSEFTEDDYYKYPTPEGTLVPRGIYKIGEDGDIPAGT